MANMDPAGPAYCVVEIENAEVVHESYSLTAAALALAPGTVYGVGRSEHEAYERAMEQRERHRYPKECQHTA
jgi:hypothetical protein